MKAPSEKKTQKLHNLTDSFGFKNKNLISNHPFLIHTHLVNMLIRNITVQYIEARRDIPKQVKITIVQVWNESSELWSLARGR